MCQYVVDVRVRGWIHRDWERTAGGGAAVVRGGHGGAWFLAQKSNPKARLNLANE